MVSARRSAHAHLHHGRPQQKVGDITDATRREPVLLTHHRKPRFVLMSVEAYESLTQGTAADKRTGFTLESMPDDVADGLLALADQYEREGRDGDA
jgi:hypothetical protein